MSFIFRSPIVVCKLAISLLALSLLAYFIIGLFLSYLGPNPIEVITHETGEWGLNFLLLTLLITPLRRHFHWSSLIKMRRFLGLWSFTFLSLHLFVFLFFDHFFDWVSIVEDVVERPYITIGFTGLVLMLPLAATSFKALQKKLGKHWVKLHRLTYLVAILGIVHYWWLVKADILWPLVYALILMVLLMDRIYWYCKKTYVRNGRPSS